MSKTIWEYKGTRPSNFPEKRIKGISYLLSETVNIGIVNYFQEKINQRIKNKKPVLALKKIMNFEGIGIQRKEEMFFNIILPFFIAFSDDLKFKGFLRFMFENYPPLKDNRLTKDFKANYPSIKINTVKEYMGALLFQKENKRKNNSLWENEKFKKRYPPTQSSDYFSNPQKQTEVKAIKSQIYQLVYKLYNLTDKEIKIIEETEWLLI